MRILTVGSMYPPHHRGAYERMWSAAVSGLRARGHDVTVLTTGHREPDVAHADEPGVHRTLQSYRQDDQFRPLGLLETARLEHANARAFERAAANAPHLVMWWAMGGMSLSLLARARRLSSRPRSLAVVHDGWPIYGPKYDRRTARYGRHLPPSRRYGVRHVDHWSFDSAHSRDLLGRGGVRIDPARTTIDHPGVDPAAFAPVRPKPWRWRLGYVGRVEPRNGVETAVRTLAALPPPAELVIAGAGQPHHEQEVRALAASLGIAQRIRWRGAVEDPATVYAKTDAVLVCVDGAAPFGLVPLEAMAVGRPVIATGTGGSGEVLRDGDNALLVPVGDPAATAAAVLHLARDPQLRERLRSGGEATVAQFTLARFCDAIAARAEDLVASAA